MEEKEKLEFVSYLEKFVTANKKQKIAQALKNRMRYISILLEDIREPHNASAAVRSCDAFGIQDVYVVEKDTSFNASVGVAKGASKWVDIKCYKNLADSIKAIRDCGYKIVTTQPNVKKTITDLSLEQKTILAFGTEISGVTDELVSYADDIVSIPMFGFTESFNVSVSVALCLYELVSRLHKSDINWFLSDKEKIDIRLQWLKNIVTDPKKYEKYFKEKGFK